MKKPSKLAVCFSLCLCLLGALGVSATSSSILNAFVPRRGQWSASVGNIEKETRSVPGTMYLNTAPHAFSLYGDFSKPNSAQDADTRISDSYYKLTLRSYTKIYCGDIYAGTRVAARVASSNIELDERYVTLKYNPN